MDHLPIHDAPPQLLRPLRGVILVALLAPLAAACLTVAQNTSAGGKVRNDSQWNGSHAKKKMPVGSADAAVKRGEDALASGNLDEALALFSEIIESHPEDHRSYYYSGFIYAQKGKKREAEEMYRLALQKKGDMPEAMNNLAALLQEKKEFPEAERLFRSALRVDPAYYEAQFNLGYLYEEWGKTDEAVEAYAAAAKMDKEDPEPLVAIGDIEAGRKEYEKAISAYKMALGRDASLLHLRIKIGVLYRKLGRNDLAAAEFELILSQVGMAEGVDLTLSFEAARELRRAGRPEKALEALLGFPPKAQESFSVQTEIGQCQLALGKCASAAAAFEKALALRPGDAQVLLALGDAYLCAGKCEEASKRYEEFLAKSGSTKEQRATIEKKLEKCKEKKR